MLEVAETVSTDPTRFAGVSVPPTVVDDNKFTVYPEKRSLISLDDRVNEIPSTENDASAPASFCFEPFVLVLSIDDNPDPEGLSVAVTLSAWLYHQRISRLK